MVSDQSYWKDTHELNSIFINQKQRTADNKIDLTQQALAKIILINDKAVCILISIFHTHCN